MVTLTFWALTILCCGYAAAFGRRDGAWAAGLIVAAVVLTAAAGTIRPGWGATNLPVMAVDTLLLAGLATLALASRSFWPMWMTAAQLLAVVTHLATLLATDFGERVYAGLESVWAIPCLGSMVVGIALDDRARGRLSGEGARWLAAPSFERREGQER